MHTSSTSSHRLSYPPSAASASLMTSPTGQGAGGSLGGWGWGGGGVEGGEFGHESSGGQLLCPIVESEMESLSLDQLQEMRIILADDIKKIEQVARVHVDSSQRSDRDELVDWPPKKEHLDVFPETPKNVFFSRIPQTSFFPETPKKLFSRSPQKLFFQKPPKTLFSNTPLLFFQKFNYLFHAIGRMNNFRTVCF